MRTFFISCRTNARSAWGFSIRRRVRPCVRSTVVFRTRTLSRRKRCYWRGPRSCIPRRRLGRISPRVSKAKGARPPRLRPLRRKRPRLRNLLHRRLHRPHNPPRPLPRWQTLSPSPFRAWTNGRCRLTAIVATGNSARRFGIFGLASSSTAPTAAVRSWSIPPCSRMSPPPWTASTRSGSATLRRFRQNGSVSSKS